jgi:hypothetical protein
MTNMGPFVLASWGRAVGQSATTEKLLETRLIVETKRHCPRCSPCHREHALHSLDRKVIKRSFTVDRCTNRMFLSQRMRLSWNYDQFQIS